MARRKRRAGSMSSTAEDGGIESTASLPAPTQPKNKRAKFEERYNAEETSDADVLGEYRTTIQDSKLTSLNHS